MIIRLFREGDHKLLVLIPTLDLIENFNNTRWQTLSKQIHVDAASHQESKFI